MMVIQVNLLEVCLFHRSESGRILNSSYHPNCHGSDKKMFSSTLSYYPGGPLLRERDGALIGAMGFVTVHVNENGTVIDVKSQVFTNILYFYDWISAVTGFELPHCQGPQAFIFP